MKPEHRQILDRVEAYLEQPGADQLRFWQALFGMDIVRFEIEKPLPNGNYRIKDDYNISDEELLKRIK